MPDVKAYAIALAIGVLVGAIYGLLNVRSPAPPVVALMGLLGILLGEQIVPLAKQLLAGYPVGASAVAETCSNHILGALPTRSSSPDASLEPADPVFDRENSS